MHYKDPQAEGELQIKNMGLHKGMKNTKNGNYKRNI